jgi:hypothetical protein
LNTWLLLVEVEAVVKQAVAVVQVGLEQVLLYLLLLEPLIQ